MDKLKNMINPGSSKDDEVMYGSGRSDDPVHSGAGLTGTQSGQSGPLGSGRSAGNDPLSSSTNPTGTHSQLGGTTGDSRFGGSSRNDDLSTSTNPTSAGQYDAGKTAGQGTHGLNEPYASRMPGGFDDDASTIASVRSGVPGQATHTGSGMTGANDPTLGDSSLSRGSGTAFGNNNPGDSGLTGQSYPDRSVGNSGYGNQSTGSSHLGRDAALGAGAGTAAHHHGNPGAGSTTGNVGPHSSNLENKLDPRVDSDRDGSGRLGGTGATGTGSGSHLDRDAALGAGAVGVGTAAHHHHDSTQRDNYAPDTGRSFPLGGNSNTTTASDYPSGSAGSYGTSGSNTSGPHSSNLANKADPRVDSDRDGSRGLGSSGYGTGTGATAQSANQGSLARDPALGAGTGAGAGGVTSPITGYGPESWEHDHNRHGHQYAGDPCSPVEPAAPGPHFVQGPHATDTANRLDPHVAGGVGGTESTTHSHGQHGRDHRREEAALAGGTLGAGLGATEGSRAHHTNPTSTSGGTGLGDSNSGSGIGSDGPAPKTAGPHNSDMLNKLDPSVDSDLSKQRGTPGTGNTSSATDTSDPYSSQASGSDPYATSASGRDHHHRGAEAGAAGAGLAGAAAYEDHRHHGNQSSGVTSGLGSSGPYSGSGSGTGVDPRVGGGRSELGNPTDSSTGAGRDHHIGRDAALGAGAGGLGYEAERHHGKHTQASDVPRNTPGSTYDNTRGPTGHDQAGSQLAGSSQQPLTGNDHHYGRDAALGAGAGGVAYEAEKRHNRDHTGLGSTPQDRLAGSGHQPTNEHHLGRDAAVGGTALGAGGVGLHENERLRDHSRVDPGTTTHDHGNERSLHHPTGHGHHKEEEALAGGAAAGGLAHHEHSKKEEKAIAKEEKAVAKEEKSHESERAKHMAAIEKDQKKHEHDQKKHEHDGEKKHGGLLGFLHKDKHDKHDKHADHTHNDDTGYDRRGINENVAGGTGAGLSDRALEGEHGSQSGVHDSSLGSGITTHDAYGSTEGHNKLHKDPPAKVLEARGQDYQGHSNVR